MNDFDVYQQQALTTLVDEDTDRFPWPAVGLASECGEVLEKCKKQHRDKKVKDWADITEEDALIIAGEIGDCLWYAAVLCHNLGIQLSTVAARNLEKLASRKDRGVLGGSGDTR